MKNNKDIGRLPIEVEGGEAFQTPWGKVGQFKGAKHEQGGIDVNMPIGSQIYSDRIAISGKTLAERKLARDRKLKGIDKKMTSADAISKGGLSRMLEKLLDEEELDLSITQAAEQAQGHQGGRYDVGTQELLAKLTPEQKKRVQEYYITKPSSDPTKDTPIDKAYDAYELDGVIRGLSGQELQDYVESELGKHGLSLRNESGLKKYDKSVAKSKFEPQKAPAAIDDITHPSPMDNQYSLLGTDINTPGKENSFLTARQKANSLIDEIRADDEYKDHTDEQIEELINKTLSTQEGYTPEMAAKKSKAIMEMPDLRLGDEVDVDETFVPGAAKAPTAPTAAKDYSGLASGLTGIAGALFQGAGNIMTAKNARDAAKATANLNKDYYDDFGLQALLTNREAGDRILQNKQYGLQNMRRDLAIEGNTARARNRAGARSLQTQAALNTATDLGIGRAYTSGLSNLENLYGNQELANLNQRSAMQMQQDQVRMGSKASLQDAQERRTDNYYSAQGDNIANLSNMSQNWIKMLQQQQYNNNFMKHVKGGSTYGQQGIAKYGRAFLRPNRVHASNNPFFV
ncbi:hypothetical protein FACS1894195_0090 [Bacteroidia bacterium]|nr:hypothetical protein FACS1894195_0090 [Bacteroidia bacterium]